LRVMSPTSYQAAPPRVRGCALYSARYLMQPLFAHKGQIYSQLLKESTIWRIIELMAKRRKRMDFILSGALLSSRDEHL
ncbi:hypothetical protein, partial [uncultured Pantoea sp.]|uniref:hypothetical protein n=1 Tax=uncultured Pantoea sp. TaxID=218084 RepID=UPI0025859AD9